MIARRPPTFMPGRPVRKSAKPPSARAGTGSPSQRSRAPPLSPRTARVEHAGLAVERSAPSPSTRSTTWSRSPSDAGTPASVGPSAGIGRRDHGTHVDDERQRLVLADDLAPGFGAVGEVGGDVEPDTGAGLGADETLVPPGDDAARAEHDRERLEPVVAVVELDAVGAAHADVVDDDGVAGSGRRALALLEHGDEELGRDLGGDFDLRLVRVGGVGTTVSEGPGSEPCRLARSTALGGASLDELPPSRCRRCPSTRRRSGGGDSRGRVRRIGATLLRRPPGYGNDPTSHRLTWRVAAGWCRTEPRARRPRPRRVGRRRAVDERPQLLGHPPVVAAWPAGRRAARTGRG